MAVRVEQIDDVAIVVAEGRFIVPQQIEELEAALAKLLDDEAYDKVLLDMSAMEFLRSISIGVIATTHARALKRHTQFFLCGMNARNRSAFDLMKFGDSLRVYDTRDEALRALFPRGSS